MKIDIKRVNQYLYEIKESTDDIKEILIEYKDEEILNNKRLKKALKFCLVEISEALSLVLQHILAKGFGIPVKGYIDTIKKAYERDIINDKLYNSLKPFFDFRNTLIHRYWTVDDSLLIQNVRRNYESFYSFIDIIREQFIK